MEQAIDVTEVYTTDGEIAQYDLLVLDDDRNSSRPTRRCGSTAPTSESGTRRVVEQLRRLEGRISEPQMQRMNAAVQEGKRERGGGRGRVPTISDRRRSADVRRHARRPGA